MATKDQTPVHELRPVTQETRIPERFIPTPTIEPGHSFSTITDHISTIVLRRKTPFGWFIGFLIALGGVGLLTVSMTVLITKGVGIWGINHPVGWGMDIINFVWWIGIGHAGTLISAILLLLRQEWRTSINRFAEAMTLFAVASAGLYPALHTGRPWYDYWLFPYPNTMGLWPQFRSPLMWDVFAVSTYATVSALFWYVGLIPDLATLRDRATNLWVKRALRRVRPRLARFREALDRYEHAYLLLAGLSTPLVLSVHTIVSFDFAVAQVPGWHATFFPPYFVAGAVFAGFAMVLTLAIPARDVLQARRLHHPAPPGEHGQGHAGDRSHRRLRLRHGMVLRSLLAATSSRRYMLKNRATGPYAKMYIALWVCNGFAPQLMWFKRFRTSPFWLFVVAMFVNVGMWLERFVIIPASLHRDFLPSSWGMYHGSIWDWSFYIGSIGLFFCAVVPLREVPPDDLHLRDAHTSSRSPGTRGRPC